MQQNFQNNYASDDIKLTDVIRAFREYSIYVIKKFWAVLIGIAIMAMAGYLYATLSKIKYEANASYNVVDSKGMGGIGALFGAFGFGAGSTSNEVLSGIMQSRHAVKSAFLSEVPYKGREEKLIHIFYEEYGIYDDWAEDPVMANYKFQAENIYEISRKEDSLLNLIYKPFVEDYLDIEYELLEGLIKTSVKTYSYEFSRGMLEKMLEYSSLFFVNKQVHSKKNSIEVSQFRVDSLEGVLSNSRYKMAIEQNKAPFLQTAEGGVELQRLAADIASISMRLTGSTEALESAKASLLADTPIINIIDHPSYATVVKKKKWKIWTLIGGLVGAVLAIMILMLIKAANDGFEKEKEGEGMQDFA